MNNEIPSYTIYEDEIVKVFLDVNPDTTGHMLIVPKKHIQRLSQASLSDQAILGHLLLIASKVATITGITETGFRTVINCGQDGGETVPHLHIHVLGGRSLQWPPG